jgi:hypothetical protein
VTSNTITVVVSHFSWWAAAVLLHPTSTPTPVVASGAVYLSANVFHSLSGGALTIQYDITNGPPLAITIHTATGAVIRHLSPAPGAISTDWDGKDDNGSPASTGLYLVAVRLADGTTVLKKVAVEKQ